MTRAASAHAAPSAASPVARGSLLSRRCACGTLSPGGAACSHCASEGFATIRLTALTGVPMPRSGFDRVVADAIASPSEPLSADLRSFMERRLSSTRAAPARPACASATTAIGPADDAAEREAARNAAEIGRSAGPSTPHDFSGVRLHSGPSAATAAARLNARAFAIGQDIVFGAGEFAPRTPGGLRLIAHELTHVAQQRAAAPSIRLLQRESLLRTLRDIVFFIPSLFGAEISYGDDELAEYLAGIVSSGRIEGGYYSDDKARQVVKRWQANNPKFALDTNKKKLLVQEMLDGRVTDGDRQGIMALLESTSPDEAAILLSPANVDFANLMRQLDSGVYGARLIRWFLRNPALHKDLVGEQFVSQFVAANFAKEQQAFAEKILRDILTAGPGLDFSDAEELKNEIFKRMRVSQLEKESQTGETGFNYPENMKQSHGCDGYVPDNPIRNARVNKAARAYWNGPFFNQTMIYYFVLSPAGRDNAYDALTSLFVPQRSICDQTLIHCDYLVNVVQFRAYAETLGTKKFDDLVKAGKIDMWLTWTGFPDPNQERPETSPKALGFQRARVSSRADLLIGDHVVFTNHLAFDGLNARQYSPWRLENAILVDKDPAGADLFQGHGSGDPVVERDMLKDLLEQYNGLARPAIELTQAIDAGQTAKEAERQATYPLVIKQQNKWVVADPNREPGRAGRTYDLKMSDQTKPESEPLLPGLLDPANMTELAMVDRPIESAPGRALSPQ